MKGGLIMYIVHILVTGMIDLGIDVLYRGNNLGRILRVLNPLQFVDLRQGSVEISAGVQLWLKSWCGEILNLINAIDRLRNNIKDDGFQPKMSPTISLSGMNQKLFNYRGNRTNSQ